MSKRQILVFRLPPLLVLQGHPALENAFRERSCLRRTQPRSRIARAC